MFKYGVFYGPNTGKYGPEKTLYLDNFHAVVYILVEEDPGHLPIS